VKRAEQLGCDLPTCRSPTAGPGPRISAGVYEVLTPRPRSPAARVMAAPRRTRSARRSSVGRNPGMTLDHRLAARPASAAGLAGCGKVGQLERPGPLFGAKRHDRPTNRPPAGPDSPGRHRRPARPLHRPARRAPADPGDIPAPPAPRRRRLPDPYANPR
jgi:hypothetical protein